MATLVLVALMIAFFVMSAWLVIALVQVYDLRDQLDWAKRDLDKAYKSIEILAARNSMLMRGLSGPCPNCEFIDVEATNKHW